jgi:hypothetical protein
MSLTAFQRRRRELAKQAEKVEETIEPKQKEKVNPLLEGLTVPKLKDIAKLEDVDKYSDMTKPELLKALEGWNLDGYHSGEEPPSNQNE